MREERGTPAWRLLLRQFESPVVWLLLGACAVAVVADLCRDRRRREVLAACIAFAGAAVWILALLFPMNDEHVLLGRIDLRGPEKASWWSTTVAPPWRTAGIVDSVESVVVPGGDSRYAVQRWTMVFLS